MAEERETSGAVETVRPAFAEKNIPVAFATDENYLPYLSVAINSLVANTTSGNLDVLVMHAGIGESARAGFFKTLRKDERLSVRFVDVDRLVGLTGLSAFSSKRYITVESCYRMLLPYILRPYEKVVYLDVDTVVRHDIGDLLSVDLGDRLFAAAIDVVNSSDKPEYAQWALGHGFDRWFEYVNTGVLVMNLAEFRRADILEPLVNVALDASRWFCDQDALNFACAGRIARLDPRWNVQVGRYCIKQQLEITKDEAYVCHFTGSEKPWMHPELPYAHLWWRYAEDLGFAVSRWRAAFGVGDGAAACGEGIAATVVVPVYNAEAYLWQALLSLAAQTLENIEVICVDDGSTDGSRAVCERFAVRDPRFRVVAQANSGAAVARNRGFDEARGRWLFFADADDFCRPDMLAEMVAQGDAEGTDVVVAGRTVIDCGHGMRTREIGVPAEYFGKGPGANCRTDGINVFSGLGFAPWNKLVRRSFVAGKGVRFQDSPSCDDAFFVFACLVAAEGISFSGKSYYYYRADLPNSQMWLADKAPVNFLAALREVKRLVGGEGLRLKEQFYRAAVSSCFDHLLSRKTPEGRRATFEALQNGGLESLRFPEIDSGAVDLGSRRRLFDIATSGGSLADILAECYQAKCESLMELEAGCAKAAGLAAKLKAAQDAAGRRKARMAELQAAAAKRDEWLAAEKAKVAERDRRVKALKALLGQRQEAVAKRDEWLAAEKAKVAKRDERVAALKALVEQKQRQVRDRDERLARAKEAAAEGERRIRGLEEALAVLRRGTEGQK